MLDFVDAGVFHLTNLVASEGLEPTNPKELIYSQPQLPLCEPDIFKNHIHLSNNYYNFMNILSNFSYLSNPISLSP